MECTGLIESVMGFLLSSPGSCTLVVFLDKTLDRPVNECNGTPEVGYSQKN